MNELIAKEYMKRAYRTIRIIKMIQRGHRSSTNIAKKVGCSKALAQWYLKAIMQ